MIYWMMAVSIVFLVISTAFTYRDYKRGKVAKGIFVRMLGITIMIAVLMVFVLIIDFGGLMWRK